MITYNYFGKEQKIYYEKLDNGLDVYVLPMKSSNRYFAEFISKFGSDIEEFLPVKEKKYVKIPDGLAHFLEHKVFDMPEGDALDYFTKKGVYANASTSFYCTKYYIEGKNDFAKCLDYLLTMIFTPYFEDQSIDSERGIIAQEIKMYQDEVEWKMDICSRECTLTNMLKGNIAGTVEDLELINADIMTKVYDTFYQPSNMFLVVSGNVNPKKVIEIVKNNQAINKRITNYPIVYKQTEEKVFVNEEYKEIRANVAMPKVRYTFKMDLDSFTLKDYDKLKLYLNLYFTFLFNEGSDFDDFINEKNIAPMFYSEHTSYKNIYLLIFEAESQYADLFINEVDKTILNTKITEEDFERIKRVWTSIIVRSFDNAYDLGESFVTDIIKEVKELDLHQLIDSLSYDELLMIINEIDYRNKTTVMMLPKENV